VSCSSFVNSSGDDDGGDGEGGGGHLTPSNQQWQRCGSGTGGMSRSMYLMLMRLPQLLLLVFGATRGSECSASLLLMFGSCCHKQQLIG
jgi:hypothetical protein